MFFEHHGLGSGKYLLGTDVRATANAALDKPILHEFFHGFTFRKSNLLLRPTDALCFRIGTEALSEVKDGGYSIRVGKDGVALCANSEKDLIRGCITLFDMIRMDDDGMVYLPFCDVYESPAIETRMIHFCVFPETELWEIRRFLRLAGALKYTHVILEFWGMLRYTCLPELAWKQGFDKDDLRPLICEARDLGLEIVPMFNHWGHASGSRAIHGKHVVLDQNPELAYLFDDSGWCWNYKSDKVRKLLKQVRAELCELCGDGSFFHIGCDEAYGFTEADTQDICGFLNDTAADLRKAGRRAIMWGDMLLYANGDKGGYSMSCPSETCATVMKQTLSRDLILADWQYYFTQNVPVKTSLDLASAGFDVLTCPWDRSDACMDASISTVRDNHLFGFLHTTWHTLSSGMYYVGKAAAECWDNFPSRNMCLVKLASLLRKVCFADGNHRTAGWSREDSTVDLF